MDEPTFVTRTVDIDLPAEDLWRLVGDSAGWAGWMVDDADVTIAPDAEGTVTDGDVERTVKVTEVVEGERVAFEWWPTGRVGATSAVELVITPTSGGAALRIVEVFPAPQRTAVASAVTAWALRTACLWASCAVPVAA